MTSTDGCVTVANARFTALDGGLVRLEWAPDGVFEDCPTVRTRQAVVPLPFASVEETDGGLTLKTDLIEIRWNGNRFDAESLQVAWCVGERNGTWTPGQVDDLNLGSTPDELHFVDRYNVPTRARPATLGEENCTGHGGRLAPEGHGFLGGREERPLWLHTAYYAESIDAYSPESRQAWKERDLLPTGLLSRAGYFVLNESDYPRFDPAAQWLCNRRAGEGYRDWYFFAYGDNYAQALALLGHLAGPVPLLPRWAFGGSFSVFDEGDQSDQLALVEGYDRHALPLDLLYVDLIWHTDPDAWEGWDWNESLYGEPGVFIERLHDRGIKLGLNLHPVGVDDRNRAFPAVAAAIGRRREESADDGAGVVGASPVGEPSHRRAVPDIARQDDATTYTTHLLGPLLDQGVDVLWIDGAAYAEGVNRQLWTNHVYTRFIEEHTGKRAMILSRAGGFDSHRYPMTFSGDIWSHWEVLAGEIDLTARGGNAGICYQSHDIGGFNGSVPFRTRPGDHTFRGLRLLDGELYVRWIQFGVFSPVFRIHSHHGIREPWLYEEAVLEATRRAMRLRSSLTPYWYHLARETYEMGMPMCRPMYLHFGMHEEAYEVPHQFMVGDRLLVAPIHEPGGMKRIWIPPGRWRAFFGNTVIEGPCLHTCCCALDEFPLFVKEGTLIPRQIPANRAGDMAPGRLVLHFAPGAETSDDAIALYEDAGDGLEYRGDDFIRWSLSFSGDRRAWCLSGAPAVGDYPGKPVERQIALLIENDRRPRITRDGRTLAVERGLDGHWECDAGAVDPNGEWHVNGELP